MSSTTSSAGTPWPVRSAISIRNAPTFSIALIRPSTAIRVLPPTITNGCVRRMSMTTELRNLVTS